MSQPVREQRLSADDLPSLGDVGPSELIDGRLVAMPPTGALHGRIEVRLSRLFDEFLELSGAGWVVSGEVGIITQRNPDCVRAADLAVIARTQSPELPDGFLTFPPQLVAEVVSPSDRWRDIQAKLDDYFAFGVGQVWVLDPAAREVLVYHSPIQATRYRETDRIPGQGVLAGLEIEVGRIFG